MCHIEVLEDHWTVPKMYREQYLYKFLYVEEELSTEGKPSEDKTRNNDDESTEAVKIFEVALREDNSPESAQITEDPTEPTPGSSSQILPAITSKPMPLSTPVYNALTLRDDNEPPSAVVSASKNVSAVASRTVT